MQSMSVFLDIAKLDYKRKNADVSRTRSVSRDSFFWAFIR